METKTCGTRDAFSFSESYFPLQVYKSVISHSERMEDKITLVCHVA